MGALLAAAPGRGQRATWKWGRIGRRALAGSTIRRRGLGRGGTAYRFSVRGRASPGERPRGVGRGGCAGLRPADMTRIVLVEDNEDLAFGLRAALEFEGYEVHVVGDGRVACDRITELA